MTDSNSFDSGDLIYATDINALNTLVNAACATAGVSGSGVGNVSSANTMTAAHVNAVVAAYQRAWDASGNKPGTRQSAVAQSGTIYGALFQNMWTQLGQMAFGDLQPDANTFYCPMTAASNNADETGSGGGLSGSDLVLTCHHTEYGGIDAIASGYRPVWGRGAFQATLAFADAFLQGRTVYSWMCKIKDYANTAGYLVEFYDGTRWFNIRREYDDGKVSVRLNGFGQDVFTAFASDPPATGDLYLAIVRNGTSFKAGWATGMFSSWAACGSTLEWTVNSDTFGSVGTAREILGNSGSPATAPKFKAAWVAMSKSALVS